MYSAKILDIFKNPINAGGLQGANGTGKYVDKDCGDFVKIYLKIDENQTIVSARFKAMGGVGTIVAGSAICSCLLDCTIDEALEIDANRIYQVTGDFPKDKAFAVDFAIKALKNAIDNYYINLEKAKKKLQNQEQTEVKVSESSANKVVLPEAQERRTVSAAKAAFDALFDL